MLHTELIILFKTYFPQYRGHINDWFPNGKGSIRIRLDTFQDLIFTYTNEQHWSLQTVDSFICQMKKGG